MSHQQPVCAICGRPTDATVCEDEIAATADALGQAADLAPDVETTVARQARISVGSSRAVRPLDETGPSGPPNRRMPVESFGWPASKDRPLLGALRATQLPVDLSARASADGAFNDITTWARHVANELGTTLPPVRAGEHPVVVASAFLLEHLDGIRGRPEAGEICRDLQAAADTIRDVVDPPQQSIVGICDCGAHLYARQDANAVTCADCRTQHDVGARRVMLMKALRGYLVTAPEAAMLAVLFRPDLNHTRLRKLINKWSERGVLVAHSEIEGSPAYRFGDIMTRLSRQLDDQQDPGGATVAA